MEAKLKHIISFDKGALDHLEVVSGLPDLSTLSDDDAITDICMFFGAAAYYAQFFEASLADFLVTYRRLAEKAHLPTEIAAIEKIFYKKTMGGLLTEIRKLFEFDNPDIDSLLDSALSKRNFLMHNFFRERSADFPSAKKRKQIFSELVETGLLFKKAMNAMSGIRAAIEKYVNGEFS